MTAARYFTKAELAVFDETIGPLSAWLVHVSITMTSR